MVGRREGGSGPESGLFFFLSGWGGRHHSGLPGRTEKSTPSLVKEDFVAVDQRAQVTRNGQGVWVSAVLGKLQAVRGSGYLLWGRSLRARSSS